MNSAPWVRYAALLVEWLLVLPLLLAVSVMLAPQDQAWFWVFIALGAGWIGVLFKSKGSTLMLWIRLVIVLLITAFSPFLLFGWTMKTAVCAILSIAAGIRGFLMPKQPWHTLIPINWLWIGLMIYAGANLFYAWLTPLQPYRSFIVTLSVVMLALTLMLMNYNQLLKAAPNREHKIPTSVIRTNQMLTMSLFVLVVGIGSISLFKNAVVALLRKIRSWYTSEEEPLDGTTYDEEYIMEDIPNLAETIEAPPITRVFELILQWAGGALAIAFVLYLLYTNVRIVQAILGKIRQLLSRWIQFRDGRATSQAYADQRERLRMKRQPSNRLRWLQKLLHREPSWRNMKTARDQAGYLYRMLIQRAVEEGYHHRMAFTPIETAEQVEQWNTERKEPWQAAEIAQEIAILYSKTRYGRAEIPSSETEALYVKLRSCFKKG